MGQPQVGLFYYGTKKLREVAKAGYEVRVFVGMQQITVHKLDKNYIKGTFSLKKSLLNNYILPPARVFCGETLNNFTFSCKILVKNLFVGLPEISNENN
jgi:hypothetical protein